MSRRTVALSSLILASFAGCSLALSTDEAQCATDTDCQSRGFVGATCVAGICNGTAGAGGTSDGGTSDSGTSDAGAASTGGPGGCVGKVAWPAPDTTVAASASLRALRLLGQTPFPGLSVKICPPFDVDCANPIGETTSDAAGVLNIPVYSGFNGHLFAAAPASFPEMAPMLVYLLPPPVEVETSMRDGNLNLASVGELSTIANLGGIEVKSEFGHIFFTAYDCLQARASKVSIKIDTLDPATKAIYISDSGVPSDVLAETQSKGEGAVINVPPGYVTVTATHADKGKYFSLTVSVRSGHITALPIAPSP